MSASNLFALGYGKLAFIATKSRKNIVAHSENMTTWYKYNKKLV